MKPLLITSAANPLIKELVALKTSNKRKKLGLIVLEGDREIELALSAGWTLETVFYCPEMFPTGEKIPAHKTYTLTETLMEKVACSEHPRGVLATAKPKYSSLSNLKLNKYPLVIVLETVEKPGNLGAILRTAYAAGVDAVIVNDPQTDIYNPNVLRASMGRVFSVPTVVATRAETIAWLKSRKIKSYAAVTIANKFHFETNFKSGAAIILGAEATGLSETWLKAADEQIKIPMKNDIDSLNVSVSAAVIIYEAQRQREV